MKKIIIVTLVVALSFVASSAFAADLGTGEVSASGGGTLAASAPATADIARFSNNVYVGVQYSGIGYALTTYHSSGTKVYGSAYDSTALFFKDIQTGGISSGTFAAPSSSLSEEAFETDGTWTKM